MARIIGVADTLDAMTTIAPYQTAMGTGLRDGTHPGAGRIEI